MNQNHNQYISTCDLRGSKNIKVSLSELKYWNQCTYPHCSNSPRCICTSSFKSYSTQIPTKLWDYSSCILSQTSVSGYVTCMAFRPDVFKVKPTFLNCIISSTHMEARLNFPSLPFFVALFSIYRLCSETCTQSRQAQDLMTWEARSAPIHKQSRQLSAGRRWRTRKMSAASSAFRSYVKKLETLSMHSS